MPQTTQELKPFFEVGHKIQLKPSGSLLKVSTFEGAHATITRIKLWPDPSMFEDPEDRQQGPHWVEFWVKLDDYPELDDLVKKMEIPFYYHELRPLLPRMTVQQLRAYCDQRLRTEQNSDRRDAYLQVKRHLNGERPGYPLISAHILPPNHSVDLINLFLSWASRMRQQAQNIRGTNPAFTLADTYEAQAQVYDELYKRLLPKKHA